MADAGGVAQHPARLRRMLPDKECLLRNVNRAEEALGGRATWGDTGGSPGYAQTKGVRDEDRVQGPRQRTSKAKRPGGRRDHGWFWKLTFWNTFICTSSPPYSHRETGLPWGQPLAESSPWPTAETKLRCLTCFTGFVLRHQALHTLQGVGMETLCFS